MKINIKCSHCKNTADIEIRKEAFCKSCLYDLLERRIRKFIRTNNYLRKNDRVLIIGEFAAQIVKDIVKGLPLNITVIDDKEFNDDPKKFIMKLQNRELKEIGVKQNKKEQKDIKDNFDKIILPWTAEHECCLFLEQMANENANFNLLGNTIETSDIHYIKLFRALLEEELETFAQFRKFMFVRRKPDIYTKMLDTMDTKYPESRFSLLKSIDSLSQALKA